MSLYDFQNYSSNREALRQTFKKNFHIIKENQKKKTPSKHSGKEKEKKL